jgi:hypothetical protein
MKYITLTISIFLVFSCTCKKNFDSDKKYYIFKKETFNHFMLIHAINDNDSVLFISNNKKVTKCVENYNYLLNDKLSQVPFFVANSDTIYFRYNSRDINNLMNIVSGYGKPGQKTTTIYSYKSFPYLLENCSNFR